MDETKSPRDATAGEEIVGRRPHVFKRLYYWVLHWAHTPYAVPALAILAFAESSFFPVPPDVLLIAMVLGNRKRALRYATICSACSVLGGFFGVLIGYYFMDLVGHWIIAVLHLEKHFDWVVEGLGANMNLFVFVAAFTPIPYKVFTIGAGVVAQTTGVSIPTFLLGFFIASAVGRSARFFLVTGLLYFLGERIKGFIDRYFEWCALAFGALLVGGFLIVKYWGPLVSAIKGMLGMG